ncbi:MULTISPECIES: TIGR04086 family membrane protein [unclassified Bacillus (in: firmicutes)]|uniref:TIGR04086 family membrane protein n=1 Tax=unclassified Bacillus (in: firmicutes) TaxID=185979 RepID=UPI000BEF674B|nr:MULTISPECIES: TIGR04086 family membrane protein [unclassified Bacillus (in: firmicutes)]PEJ51782.1 TIGR04086 family membrane protein [Bacillus sp. AFS002410]PEK98656.1 TIGR04086 family membrane protein [Bacillus sp. AFS017336]
MKKTATAVSFGFLTILLLVLSISLILSLLLRLTSLTESSVNTTTLVLSFIVMLIGGFVTGAKGKEKGWILGFLTSGAYSVFVFFVQFLGYDRTFSKEQLMYHAIFIAICMLGSIFGVNAASNKSYNK